ncbi:MAG: rhomboid family intramembrane serine protease [Gemmatimonadota bacterium]
MAYRGSFSFGFGLTPWVQRLIIANAVVFLLQSMVPVLSYYLAFTPAQVLLKPWTIVTYMFAHGGFMHLFWNMLGLFFFGPPLEGRWGSREFLKFYFICGLGGAALSFLFAFGSPIIGASAAVYGVMLAFALNWPDAPIYIWGILPVKAKYLVMVLAAMSIFSMFNTSDNIAHAAHLGGFAAAFIYLRLSGPGGPLGGVRKMMTRRRMRVVRMDEPAGTRAARPSTLPAAAASRRVGVDGEEDKLLDELDRVLEKISTEGMSSLTPQERRLLDEVSRRYRTD